MYIKELVYIPHKCLFLYPFLVLGLIELMVDESTTPLYHSADSIVEDAALPALPTVGSAIHVRKGEAR